MNGWEALVIIVFIAFLGWLAWMFIDSEQNR